MFNNPISTIDNLNIVLKDSFNNLIYKDYLDILPIYYLTVDTKIHIYFEDNLKKANYVSNILIGDMININDKLENNKGFTENILSKGMLHCFQRFIIEGLYIFQNTNNLDDGMISNKVIETETQVNEMIKAPIQLKGYYSDNISLVSNIAENYCSIEIPSYFSTASSSSSSSHYF